MFNPPYGWAVFPVRPGGKEPLTEHGYKDASTDPEQIAAWEAQFPGCNWGTPTPLVLDIDPRNGGIESFGEWEARNGPMPEGPRTKTGGGGWHYFFAPVEGGAGWNGEIDEYPGMDLKGSGRGYVVIPPSRTAGPYEWLDGSDALPVPDAPERLQTLARGRPKSVSIGERRHFKGTISAYSRAALDRELDGIRRAPNGTRNNQLNRAAFSLATLHAAGQLPDVRPDLLYAAIDSGLASEDGEDSVRATIESGWSAGTRYPRDIKSNGVPPMPPSDDAAKEEDPYGDLVESACNDVANGRRLVRMFGADLRYVPTWSRWLLWDGARWETDSIGHVEQLAKQVVRTIYQEAVSVADESEQKRLGRHAVNSGNVSKLKAMVQSAQSEPGIAVVPDQLDAHVFLLACPNGVVDLTNGDLHPARREDLITRRSGISYDPNADCPRWMRFLQEVLPDPTMRTFVQRSAGYSLTASTAEQCLFILFGAGANGKSTLVETLLYVFGDYAMRSPTEMLLARKSDAIPNDIAQLKGARMVATSEVESGRRLGEALVKQLTGSDSISARFMRSEWFEFKPTCKFWLSTNHKPVIRGTDEGIWRRIRLIPFLQTFPEEARDPALPATLRGEAEGILAWAVRGCVQWMEHGLPIPEGVEEATDSYRREMDTTGDFLDDETELDANGWVTSKDLYKRYVGWCEENGHRSILSQKKLGEALREKGYADDRTKAFRLWRGLRLVTERPAGMFEGDAF